VIENPSDVKMAARLTLGVRVIHDDAEELESSGAAVFTTTAEIVLRVGIGSELGELH